jgi:hypothetical protein
MAGAGRAGRSLVDGFIGSCREVARLLPTRLAETWIRSASIAVKRKFLAVDLTVSLACPQRKFIYFNYL